MLGGEGRRRWRSTRTREVTEIVRGGEPGAIRTGRAAGAAASSAARDDGRAPHHHHMVTWAHAACAASGRSARSSSGFLAVPVLVPGGRVGASLSENSPRGVSCGVAWASQSQIGRPAWTLPRWGCCHQLSHVSLGRRPLAGGRGGPHSSARSLGLATGATRSGSSNFGGLRSIEMERARSLSHSSLQVQPSRRMTATASTSGGCSERCSNGRLTGSHVTIPSN